MREGRPASAALARPVANRLQFDLRLPLQNSSDAGGAKSEMSRRDSRPRKTQTKNQICACGVSGYHRHCVICSKPLRADQRAFCGEACRTYDKHERLKLRSVRCWIEPIDGGPKLRRWIPKRFVRRLRTSGYLGRHSGRATQRGSK
jgi:predicted nucleic acid-binding Zn ribbon protein